VKDPRLEEKLIAELPGISQWAIVGWRRLNQRGAFSVPDIVNEGIQDFKETSSYELAFLLEDCDFGPDQKDAVTSKDDLYAAYTRHALARGYKPKSYPVFFREVYSVSDQKIKEYRPRAIAGDPDGKRKAMVKGVKLIKLRVNKDDRLGIADPQATLLLNGADAVAEDLLILIESLGRDGQHQVVAALLGRLQRPQAA
jgi:phage/plasmid-associated DNA primase